MTAEVADMSYLFIDILAIGIWYFVRFLVSLFLLSNGIEINKANQYGRRYSDDPDDEAVPGA